MLKCCIGDAVNRACPAAAVKAAFATISEEPIASASLAQVHVAYLHDGTKVAVKVQHRGLREACNVDMAVVEALVHAVKWWKEEVDYRWIADEMRRNLPLELDFKHEAQNAARCARHFAHRDDIVVPSIVSELTTHRVLVMSFEDGVSVADSAGLAARRLDKAEVAEPVTIANARQRNHLNVLATRDSDWRCVLFREEAAHPMQMSSLATYHPAA